MSHAHHSHPHKHAHGAAHGAHGGGLAPRSALRISLVLTAGFLLVEAAMGWYTGSLALLADAGHMLSDTGALALALLAQSFAARAHTPRATFGFRRAEVLAAFLNGIALALISVWIAVQAVGRWWQPEVLRPHGLLETASAGLVVNVVVAWVLSRSNQQSVNVRAALAHVIADLLGSLGAVAAGAAVVFWQEYRADTVLSLLITLLVAHSGWRILRETSAVLLESAPSELDTSALAQTIAETSGVASFHDLHAWRISDGFDAVTVHVVLVPDCHGVEVCQRVCQRVESIHGIRHVTVQPEAPPPALVQLGRPRARAGTSASSR
ncbi:MAG: cation diffusion facilitator family transporter [Deltaproteobacteria bacterium]